jgi:(S)-2-hydroxyglutarate dehydrogenase
VRAQVIDRKGNFMKEAIEFDGPLSYHIINYNSPGATGSPAFAAYLVDRLAKKGHFDHLSRRSAKGNGLWDFEAISQKIGSVR